MIDRFNHFLAWLGGRSHLVLITVLLIVGGTWGFVELADEVTEGDTQTFDEQVLLALRQSDDLEKPIGPGWLHEAGRDVTALGGVLVLTLLILLVLGYLLMVRKYHAIWLVLGASVGAIIISSTMKELFARERPDLVPHLSKVYTYSFPSGHALMSSAVYLTLGVMLARLVPRRRLKIYFISVAILLTLLIGFSRVYMGVHFPTDVLAGWTVGLIWALFCWLVARQLQIRGTVEKDVEETAPSGAHVPTQPDDASPPEPPDPPAAAI